MLRTISRVSLTFLSFLYFIFIFLLFNIYYWKWILGPDGLFLGIVHPACTYRIKIINNYWNSSENQKRDFEREKCCSHWYVS